MLSRDHELLSRDLEITKFVISRSRVTKSRSRDNELRNSWSRDNELKKSFQGNERHYWASVWMPALIVKDPLAHTQNNIHLHKLEYAHTCAYININEHKYIYTHTLTHNTHHIHAHSHVQIWIYTCTHTSVYGHACIRPLIWFIYKRKCILWLLAIDPCTVTNYRLSIQATILSIGYVF